MLHIALDILECLNVVHFTLDAGVDLHQGLVPRNRDYHIWRLYTIRQFRGNPTTTSGIELSEQMKNNQLTCVRKIQRIRSNFETDFDALFLRGSRLIEMQITAGVERRQTGSGRSR